jgi:hypothetical protein
MGLSTWLAIRRAQRARMARYPRVRTSEDRASLRRMEGLMLAAFIAVVLVPLVLLFADRLADLDYGQRALAVALEAAR